ncbi:hypothetical protein FB451DRAFT_347663 [Mycena latifolia]|nr:hypothetical protein FB451DRAFT_347663 [Mycena latifolia]
MGLGGIVERVDRGVGRGRVGRHARGWGLVAVEVGVGGGRGAGFLTGGRLGGGRGSILALFDGSGGFYVLVLANEGSELAFAEAGLVCDREALWARGGGGGLKISALGGAGDGRGLCGRVGVGGVGDVVVEEALEVVERAVLGRAGVWGWWHARGRGRRGDRGGGRHRWRTCANTRFSCRREAEAGAGCGGGVGGLLGCGGRGEGDAEGLRGVSRALSGWVGVHWACRWAAGPPWWEKQRVFLK